MKLQEQVYLEQLHNYLMMGKALQTQDSVEQAELLLQLRMRHQ